MTLKQCHGCGSTVQDFLNYCTWDCQVNAAIREGGRVHTPNNLPIRCITANGTLLEHEHGDHPTYMYPVEVEYVGELTNGLREDARMLTGKDDLTDEQVRDVAGEVHALIYADGHVALTLYECCYAMWFLSDGLFQAGSLWTRGDWKLADTSLRKIKGDV